MTSTLIERVARAVDPELWNDIDKSIAHDVGPTVVQGLEAQQSFKRAQAALKAIREPTFEMVHAGALEICDDSADPISDWYPVTREAFTDMINTALKEGYNDD